MKLQLLEERWTTQKRAGGVHVSWAAFLSFAFSFCPFLLATQKKRTARGTDDGHICILSDDDLDIQMKPLTQFHALLY
jgi:hypothetical protein